MAADDGPSTGTNTASAEAQRTSYRIGVDAGTVDRLEVHGGDEGNAGTFPSDMGPGDVAHLVTGPGWSRDDAVTQLLDATGGGDRVERVRKAEKDGVDLNFVVAAAGNVGEVPVKTEIERRRRVGRS